GWFTEPKPFIEGSLSQARFSAQSEAILNDQLESLSQDLSSISDLHGTLSVRVGISKNGSVLSGKILTHTLISKENTKNLKPPQEAISHIFRSLGEMKFPKTSGKSELT